MERILARKFGKGKMASLIEAGRPWNSIIVVLLSVLGFMLSSQSLPSFLNVLILATTTFLIYNGCTTLNDLYDIKVDSVNMPFRPLERGSLKVKDVIYYSVFSYAFGIMISLLVSFQFFVSILLMFFSSITYSLPPFSLERRGFLGNVNLGFASVFTTLYAGMVLATGGLAISEAFLLQVLSFTLLFSFFCILKDFKDFKGDKIHNKRTIAVKHGIKNASRINIIGTLVSFPLTILVFYFFSFQNSLFLLSSSILFVLLMMQEFKVYKSPDEATGEKAWSIGRIVFLVFSLSLLIF